MSKKKKNKKKKIRKDVLFIINFTAGILNIIGLLIKGLIGYFTYTFIEFNRTLSYIILAGLMIWFLLDFIYKFRIIPENNADIKDMPLEEIGLTFIQKMSVIFRKVIYMSLTVGALTFAANPVVISDDIIIEENIDVDSQNDHIDDNHINDDINSDEQENLLTEEQKIIEEYIVRSYEEIIPKDELKHLTKEQLYYIRNGIFAYAGQYFESGYYNVFSWYTGDVAPEDIYIKLNYYQNKNINNICTIEEGK